MSISLTERAATELKSLIGQEVEKKTLGADAMLRLGVTGGGCSGFLYKMGFDQSVNDADRVNEISGVKVVMDSRSYLYLEGTEVDFQDGPMGSGFVFNNPNTPRTCGGCGCSA